MDWVERAIYVAVQLVTPITCITAGTIVISLIIIVPTLYLESRIRNRERKD